MMTLEICNTETSLEFLRPPAEQEGGTAGSSLPHIQEALDKNIHSAVS